MISSATLMAQFNPIIHSEATTNNPPKFQFLSTVPPGTWYSNNLIGPAFLQPTNSGDGWAFASGVTQAIRTRFAPHPLWDGSNVYVEISTLCTGTNHAASTNAVFGVMGASLNDLGDESNPTFGAEVLMTNHVASVNATYRKSKTISGPVIVGNSPNATNDILWQIRRLSPGPGSADTETNVNLCLMQVKFFFLGSLTNYFYQVPSP